MLQELTATSVDAPSALKPDHTTVLTRSFLLSFHIQLMIRASLQHRDESVNAVRAASAPPWPHPANTTVILAVQACSVFTLVNVSIPLSQPKTSYMALIYCFLC